MGNTGRACVVLLAVGRNRTRDWHINHTLFFGGGGVCACVHQYGAVNHVCNVRGRFCTSLLTKMGEKRLLNLAASYVLYKMSHGQNKKITACIEKLICDPAV